MAKGIRTTVYNDKDGVTRMGVGQHKGCPVYKLPQRYIDWCLENLPEWDMVRQVAYAEDVRRRVDGWEPDKSEHKTKLAGDIVTPKRRRSRSRSRSKSSGDGSCQG